MNRDYHINSIRFALSQHNPEVLPDLNFLVDDYHSVYAALEDTKAQMEVFKLQIQLLQKKQPVREDGELTALEGEFTAVIAPDPSVSNPNSSALQAENRKLVEEIAALKKQLQQDMTKMESCKKLHESELESYKKVHESKSIRMTEIFLELENEIKALKAENEQIKSDHVFEVSQLQQLYNESQMAAEHVQRADEDEIDRRVKDAVELVNEDRQFLSQQVMKLQAEKEELLAENQKLSISVNDMSGAVEAMSLQIETLTIRMFDSADTIDKGKSK